MSAPKALYPGYDGLLVLNGSRYLFIWNEILPLNSGYYCCAHFVSLQSLQSALCDLGRVRVMVTLVICKLRTSDFKIMWCTLQIVHIDKLHATLLHVQ